MAATIQIIVSSSSSGSAVKDAKQDVRGLGDAAEKSGGGFTVMKGLAVNALTAIGSMALEAAAGIGKFVADSVGAAANFESSMFGLQAVTGDALTKAGFSLEDVSEKALQLGADTQFSAQQAVDAMTELAKGGVPVAAIMSDATDATLALASATGLDLAPAAEIVAKQLGVWGETGVTAAQVTDLLASAANASTVDVDELALGLANVGGVARESGVEFDDLVQTMALIAPSFSSAADAGTSLKTLIANMQPATEKAKDTMIALGLATEDGVSRFYDAQGSFIGMEQAAQLLHEALAGLSEADTTQALKDMFGIDAFRAAGAIARDGAAGFNEMGQAMIDSGGAAAAAATKNQGFSFAMEQLKGSIETIQIVIGTMLLPILTDLLNAHIIPGINYVLALAQSFDANQGPISAVSAFFTGTLVPALSTVWTWIQGNILPILSNLGAALGGTLPAVIQILTGYWNDVLLPALNMVWGFISTVFLPILAATAEWLAVNLPPAVQMVADFLTGTLFPALSTVYNFISANVIPVLATVTQWLIANVPAAIQKLSDYWNTILLPAITAVWEFFQNSILPVLAAVANVADAVLGLAVRTLAKAWSDTLKPALDAVWGFFQNSILPVLREVATVISDTVGPPIESFEGWIADITGGLGGLKSAVDGVIGFLNSMADAIRSMPSLPDVFTPGSPTPAELGFRGIASALSLATVSMQGFGGATMGLAASAPMVAGAGGGGMSTSTANYNQQRSMVYSPTINNFGRPSDGLDYSTARSLSGV